MRTFIARRSVKIGGAIAAVVVLLAAAIGGFVLARANAAKPYLPPLVYFTTGQGRLYALNVSTHQTAWVQNGLHGKVFYWTPVLYAGNVYVSFSGGTIDAFSERTQRLMWQTNEGNGTIFGAGDGDVFGQNDKSFFALDAHSGALLWKHLETSGINGDYYYANEGFVFDERSAIGQVEAYYAYPGTSHWVANLHVTQYIPGFSPGVIYLPCTDGLYALDITNGHILWHNPSVHGGVSYGNGRVYVTGAYAISALSATTGTQIWKYSTTSSLYEGIPATVTANVVYAQPGNGHIYAFNPTTGALLWNIYNGNGYPVAGTPLSYAGYLFTIENGQLVARLASNGSFQWAPPIAYPSSGLALLPANVPSI